MLHKIIAYKTDRISNCRILKMTGVIMKGHLSVHLTVTVALVKQSFKIQVVTVTKI